jgi:hypothetical protein
MFTPKTRGTVPQRRFADDAKKAKGRTGGGNFKKVEGKFDRLKLGEQPVWLRISPDQLYTQLVWDGEAKEVVEVTRPWFESVGHFVPGKQRGFNCSAGPHRDQPCRGCAIRAWFFDRLRAKEKEIAEKTGIDPRRNKDQGDKKRDDSKSPPVQASKNFAMGVTVLEKCFEMQAMGKGGKPRTNREGKAITNIVPAPLSGLSPLKRREMPGEFGYNYHYGVGSRELASLANMDMDLWNSCANCAHDLVATEFVCTSCEVVCFDEPSGLRGADLRAMREQEMKCQSCGHEGPLNPVLSCSHCENPAEGSILAFDLRLKKVKLDDNSSQLSLEEFRVPDYVSLFDDDVANRVSELIMSPLDIPAIFAPDTIEAQAWMLPEDLKAIDPMYHVKNKKTSAAYGSGDGTEGEGGDPDQMQFDESNGENEES